MVKIGNIELCDKPLFLAPMEDITDPSFRYMCKQFGADMMYTEFISSDGLIRDGRKSLQKLNLLDDERPVGIQIYGHLIEPMVESAVIAEKANPDVIDLNFGCPVKKIASRGAGSGMMKNLPLMEEMTRRVVQATHIPVTAKTRLGWDEENKNVLEAALRMQSAGIKALTIHGRTRPQMYKGTAKWDLIREVKKHPEIEIPIIGNGDINSGLMAADYFAKYAVDGIMIGRASIGRPWIFKEIRHFLETGEEMPPPTVTERVDIAIEHFKRSLEYKEGARGIYEMRRHFALYFKGLPHFKPLRMELLTTHDVDSIFDLLGKIRREYGDFRPENPVAYPNTDMCSIV
ncbi:MAG: tRNA dihydrouridine synthase DusB [Bacteroidota bacterium]|nr:tRNA dihydrouridine synthase DusB [Bacteroidota bacterium]